ncbi:MAG TPA: ABC transporter permease [Acidimicrobiales bacterium]|nr:ABC transporter permease [Acidimicrobiales bacterium]
MTTQPVAYGLDQVPDVGPDLVAAPPEGGEVYSQGSVFRLILRTFTKNVLAVLGIIIVCLMVLFCFVGPLLYHTDQVDTNIMISNEGPMAGHLLGTDNNGYDVLGRLMVGGQSSIEIGLSVAVIATFLGVVYGAIAGYFGKVVDAIMMRVVDILLAIPVVFLFIFIAAIRTTPPTTWLLIGILAGLSWLAPARLVRGETLSLRTREYVKAVKVMGGRSGRVVFRHIIPNAIGTIIVNATFQVADAILILAVLQYLGFSLPPPTATWGQMLSQGTTFLSDGYWWQVYPALLCIILVVVAFNFIGDALRDSFEVRLQER